MPDLPLIFCWFIATFW